MYNILKHIWLKWLSLLNKIFDTETVNNMDEINKMSYYLLKYFGLPFIFWFIYKMIIFEISVHLISKNIFF